MKCRECGHENSTSAKFCSNCGIKPKRTCSHCGVANPPGGKFCFECGGSLTATRTSHKDSQSRAAAPTESSGDTRRITDLRNTVGDRYAIFTGVDDLALEASILGIDGWVAGTGIAFPRENQHFWELTRRGEWEKAREI